MSQILPLSNEWISATSWPLGFCYFRHFLLSFSLICKIRATTSRFGDPLILWNPDPLCQSFQNPLNERAFAAVADYKPTVLIGLLSETLGFHALSKNLWKLSTVPSTTPTTAGLVL